jgi:hypothetical protein
MLAAKAKAAASNKNAMSGKSFLPPLACLPIMRAVLPIGSASMDLDSVRMPDSASICEAAAENIWP